MSHTANGTSYEEAMREAGLIDPVQVRIEIALNLEGWYNLYLDRESFKTHDHRVKPIPVGTEPKSGRLLIVPEYFEDLNAIHEAEKGLVHPCEANKGKPNDGVYYDAIYYVCGRSNRSVKYADSKTCALALYVAILDARYVARHMISRALVA